MGAFDDLIPPNAGGAFDDLIPKGTVFDFTAPNGKQYTVTGPAGSTPQQAFAVLNQQLGNQKPWEQYGQSSGPWNNYQQASPAEDFAKSIPTGMVTGLVNATSGPAVPDSPIPLPPEMMGGAAPVMEAVQKDITGPLYQPQGRAGKYGAAVGEALGNPLSYVGPGSLPLKVGASVLGSVGSEAGGQATEGTGYETAGKVAGSLLGGVAGVKAFGPAAERTVAPTLQDLKNAEDAAYTAARNSGVQVDAGKLADWAVQKEQQLGSGPQYAFTGGQYGTAPKTMAPLSEIQNPPQGASITASNLDTLRRRINDVAGEIAYTDKGPRPTPDAKAAMVLKREYADLLENPPPGLIVAGDANDFVSNIRTGNATHSALLNAGNIQQRISNAEENTAGSIAARLDNQIKSQVRPILRNPKAQRGYTPEEVAQIRALNRGGSGPLAPISPQNILSQVGRLGAGVIPAAAHIGMAVGTGGASIPAQAAFAATTYAARKAAEQMTLNRAQKLVQALIERSPESAARKSETDLRNTLTAPARSAANRAALARALLQMGNTQ